MALTDKKIVDGKSGFELEDLRNEKLHMVCLKGAEFHVDGVRINGIYIKDLLEKYITS